MSGTLQLGGTNLAVHSGSGASAKITLDSGLVFPAGGTGNPISVAIIADEKASTSLGGSSSAGSWQTRELNTEISDPDSIVSISSNQFTLAAGTYVIQWSCPALDAGRHQSKLYSITYATDLAGGTSETTDLTALNQTRSFGEYVHTITSSHTYEIQHYFASARASNGLGIDGRTGINSIYTIVKISKLK